MITNTVIIEYDEPADLLHTVQVELSDAGDAVVIYDQCDECDRTSVRVVEIPLEHAEAVAAAILRVVRRAQQ